MEISVDKSGAFPVVRILGDMRLWGKQGFADQVREALHSLMHAGNKKIVLSLAQVTRIDSRGIGCLARCHATSITHGSEISLVLSPGVVQETLKQLNFVRLYPIFPDEAAALGQAKTA